MNEWDLIFHFRHDSTYNMPKAELVNLDNYQTVNKVWKESNKSKNEKWKEKTDLLFLNLSQLKVVENRKAVLERKDRFKSLAFVSLNFIGID